MTRGVLHSLRHSLLQRRQARSKKDRPERRPSSTRVAAVALAIFVAASLYPVWRNHQCPGFHAGLVLVLVFSSLYGAALAVPLLAGRGPSVIVAAAGVGLLVCGYAFSIAYSTIAPGCPVVRAEIWSAGQSLLVESGYRGRVTVKLRGMLAGDKDDDLRVKIDGTAPPIVATMASSRRHVRVGWRKAHLLEREVVLNIHTVLGEGPRTLRVVQLAGNRDGPLMMEIFPEGLRPLGLPIALVSLAVSAFFQSIVRIKAFAGLTVAAIGAAMAVVHRLGPAPELDLLPAPLIFGGGLGVALGVTATEASRRARSAILRHRRASTKS